MQIEEDPNNDDLTSSEDAVIPESSYPKDHHDVYVTMPADVSCAMGRLLKKWLYVFEFCEQKTDTKKILYSCSWSLTISS